MEIILLSLLNILCFNAYAAETKININALFDALIDDDLTEFKSLYENINNPNFEIYGSPFLHHASGDKIASFLIDQGANINALDDFGRTPLINAARIGLPERVKFFVESGSDYYKHQGF